MNYSDYKNSVLKAAMDMGCSAAEVYFTDGENFSANVNGGELESYTVEHTYGLNLRVQLDGKDGYAYTEVLDDPPALAMRAIDNARAIESTDIHPMQGKCSYQTVNPPVTRLSDMTPKQKIELAMQMEKTVLQADPRVDRVDYCMVSTYSATTRIHNTLGLEAEKTTRGAYNLLSPILRQDGVEKDSFAFRVGDECFDTEGLAREAIDAAAQQFNASPVSSGEYRVILRNDAAGDLLSAFIPLFSADAAQKGLSLLKGKENQSIASEIVSITDDPFRAENPRAFDGEGVPSVRTEVVTHGVLNTFLHNLKTALIAGVASTSNAGRSGGAIGVSPSNFYIEAGKPSLDELIATLNNGLMITEISGLHAGLNTVSGDFSLIAKGILVENGKKVRSVDQITVAGNFLTLMKSISAVGSDLRFGMPNGGRVGSPSLLVDRVVISG